MVQIILYGKLIFFAWIQGWHGFDIKERNLIMIRKNISEFVRLFSTKFRDIQ